MIESYFEYILSMCGDTTLSSVCNIYKTKADSISAAKKGFNGKNYILGQGLLIFAAEDFIAENGYIADSELGKDAKKVLSRFCRNLKKMKKDNQQRIEVDKEFMFNSLTDLNWLLSSKYYYVKNNLSGKIELLTLPTLIRIWLKKALEDVIYEKALYYQERCEQYSSAQLFRYQLLSGAHPDSEVKKLYAQGYTSSDFESLESQTRECSIKCMALFFGLTATAARVEEIRRMR